MFPPLLILPFSMNRLAMALDHAFPRFQSADLAPANASSDHSGVTIRARV